jgi:hypothetical protein
VKNVWNNGYLKSGWVIPFVGIGLCFGAFLLYEDDIIPLWAFALMAIFCEPIGGPIGSFLLMIRFGGKRRFVAWRLYQLTEEQFDKLNHVCRTAKNQEVANKIYKQELAFRLLDRYENPFCRAFFKPPQKDMPQVHNYLDTGLVKAKTYLGADPRVNAVHSRLQELSEMAHTAQLYS